MGEVLERISATELTAITAELADKHVRMREALRHGPPDEDGVRTILRLVFSTRRRAATLIDTLGADLLGKAMFELVWGTDPIEARWNAFDGVCSQQADLTLDLPGELLHFTRPSEYWLWTRWILDPSIGTGALPLLTMDEVELEAADRGQTYVLVGRATAFVSETARATGFTAQQGGPFDVDVFLAAVYGIYMYTVLRMRMTQEFTNLIPELPALIRRLLGVYYMEA